MLRAFASKFMGDNGLQFTFFYTVFVRLGSVLSFFFLKDLCKIGVVFKYLIRLSSGSICAWRVLFQELFNYRSNFFNNYRTVQFISCILVVCSFQGIGPFLLSGWIYEHYEQYYKITFSIFSPFVGCGVCVDILYFVTDTGDLCLLTLYLSVLTRGLSIVFPK